MKAALRIISIAVVVLAVVIFVDRSFDAKLWLDELFTISLMKAASLPDLWAAIVSGIDGNPPLYMTAAWLILHALPRSISWIATLTWLNVAFVAAALAILFRISRRLVSAPASWMAVFLFAAFNDGITYLVLELRTYALYFLMMATCVLFQQRLLERRSRADFILLSFLYCLLALTHTFGILYVLCIGLSACISTFRRDRTAAKLSLLAMVPALLVFAAWLPFLLTQMQVAKPYGWIPRPGFIELVKTVFPTPLSALAGLLEMACLAGFMPWYLRAASTRAATDQWSQLFRFVCLLLLAVAALATFAWTTSKVAFPLFVPRYFTPELTISFALGAALCEVLVEFFRAEVVPQQPRLVQLLAVATPALLALTLVYKVPTRPKLPCLDSAGGFFEGRFVRDGMPVVVESPHVWLPRMHYSQYGSLYHFPLDWDVVLKFPNRATNNATDFNIMQRYKRFRFAGSPTILSTADIVRAYPQFLVLSESGRAWFHNLSEVKHVTAEKLAEIPDYPVGNVCTLWHVKSVQDRP